AAQGCEIVVSDFKTPGDAPVFEKSPQLVAFLRCAVDIRTIDVAAASRAGVLVTRASPGFVAAVTELVLGLLVDLSRGVSRSAAAYHAGHVPKPEAGRLRHRRRTSGGADAQSRHRGPPRRHRDAALGRPHAAGDRTPGFRHGRAGRRDRARPRAQRRGERAARDAARAPRKDVSKERSMKKILITGAAGDVGSHLRRELAGRYALRLSDIRPIRNLAAGEEFMRGDCASLQDMLRATRGVAAVVHLGGFSVEGPWEVILRANI